MSLIDHNMAEAPAGVFFCCCCFFLILMLDQYLRDERFRNLMCLSCDPPSDPNTMPPLIQSLQSHDGLK